MVNSWVRPKSVIDLGCGLGLWLSVWREPGCDVPGVDGDWVERARLAIPQACFTQHDLSTPYEPDRRYDLAVFLEAAHYLPLEAAAPLVHASTTAADVVLFSAAIPHQPGKQHVNSQWPDYWSDLFAEQGYVLIDTLRQMIWDDERIDWWYRQNILIFVARDKLGKWPELEAMQRASPKRPLRMIHPAVLQRWVDWGMAQSRRYWELHEKVEAQGLEPSL
jgi:hypothetical protein